MAARKLQPELFDLEPLPVVLPPEIARRLRCIAAESGADPADLAVNEIASAVCDHDANRTRRLLDATNRPQGCTQRRLLPQVGSKARGISAPRKVRRRPLNDWVFAGSKKR